MACVKKVKGMSKTINVVVKDKIAATVDNTVYVCGNSDFVIVFDFDEEWKAFDAKTARFAYEGRHQDIVFTGNECPVPVISGTHRIRVGVFAGDLHTTTPAYIPAKKSILCDSGSPETPKEDVYAQIMELLQGIEIIDRETIAESVVAAVEAAKTATEQAVKVETALGEALWIGFELDKNGELYAVLSPGSEASFYLDENGFLGVQMNV